MKEQTRYEQFFFDEATTQRLAKLASRFECPLFLCMPSLALYFHKLGKKCWLYDHDKRFSFLKSYRYYDLFEPFCPSIDFDALFVDPPFSNIDMKKLGHAIQAINGLQQVENLFVCHISASESSLKMQFESYGLQRYPRHLGYQSVRDATQKRIFLFGPEDYLKYDS